MDYLTNRTTAWREYASKMAEAWLKNNFALRFPDHQRPLTCEEVRVYANLFHHAGHPITAEEILALHREDDGCGAEHSIDLGISRPGSVVPFNHAVREFVTTWVDNDTACDYLANGCEIDCDEANALADLFAALGFREYAGKFLAGHALNDGPGKKHYTDPQKEN